MNKKIKKRALTVFAAMCAMYLVTTFNVQDRIGMKRVIAEQGNQPNSMHLLAPGERSAPSSGAPPKPLQEPAANRQRGEKTDAVTRNVSASSGACQSSLSYPLFCAAVQTGQIDAESLVESAREDGTTAWRKPVEILRQGDEEGLGALARLIGKRTLLDLLQNEGIAVDEGSTAEELFTGRTWRIDKDKLLALYKYCLPARFDGFFPVVDRRIRIVKAGETFHVLETQGDIPVQGPSRDAWTMPDLLYLPMRAAVEKLTAHTGRIRVLGSGHVVEQYPKPSERLSGETECILYGRSYVQ